MLKSAEFSDKSYPKKDTTNNPITVEKTDKVSRKLSVFDDALRQNYKDYE